MNNQDTEQRAETTLPDAEQLRQGCHFCLEQCDQLLSVLSAEDYASSAEMSSIGAHVRHILERFQCFLSGLNEGSIDYDARKRDRSLETNKQAALFALTTVSRRIEELGLQDHAGQELNIRESVHPQLEPALASSSVERELVSLISHSVHHLAIIAMLARPLGYQFDSDFGKAPSTIIHEKN